MKRDSFHTGLSVAGLVLGLWVFVSPWVIADASGGSAAWNFHVTGLLAVFFAAVALVRTDDLPQYGLIAVGVLLMASPWMLDLDTLITRQTVFYGLFLVGFAWFGRYSYKPKAQTDG